MLTKSRNWVAIFQLIDRLEHAALVYSVCLWYWTPMSCYRQLTPVKARYPLTSIIWPHCGIRFYALWGNGFFLSWPLPKYWFSIESQTQVRLTFYNQVCHKLPTRINCKLILPAITKSTSCRKTYLQPSLRFEKDWSKSNVHAIIVFKFDVSINQRFTVQTKQYLVSKK